MAREGKGKTWPNSVVRERKEIFLVPLGQLDPLLLPKILGAVIFSYKTWVICREQNISLRFIYMFLGIYSSPRNAYHFLGKQNNYREKGDFSGVPFFLRMVSVVVGLYLTLIYATSAFSFPLAHYGSSSRL
jgi:hypothetical protein